MSIRELAQKKLAEESDKPSAPKKNAVRRQTVIKKVEMSQEMKRLLERIDRNLDKTWGYDNKMGKEKGRPKYRNLWEDWNAFKEYLKDLM